MRCVTKQDMSYLRETNDIVCTNQQTMASITLVTSPGFASLIQVSPANEHCGMLAKAPRQHASHAHHAIKTPQRHVHLKDLDSKAQMLIKQQQL